MPRPPHATVFRQTEEHRDTLTVAKRDAKISAFSFSETNPDIGLRGFKDWMVKSHRSKQMMGSVWENPNSGNEN